MSAGPSLYRRHRPRTFDDVVGQEHVVRTLRNALDQGKVHHAYLFVGSRGTGKTSMAKMLAACLNCERGPTTEPCGTCASCVAIANATSLDVVEMDAASNNSVDDIRALRDAVAYAPVTGRTKVYILDEAHMLSPQAWNAFLKTLEEPPPSTIFVLATTEANKVLPTVVDRCHRFDFHRPTVEQLQTVLSRVAGQEQFAIGADAIALIARHATGSFRDALGTLEQLVTYSGATIATEDVLAVLGVADADMLFDALDAIAAGDARGALHAAAAIAGTGRDLMQACKDLEVHARSLLVVQTLGEVPSELRVTPDLDERLAAQARAVPPASVVRLLDLLAAGIGAMKDGADPRTQLELALVKAAAPEVDPSARALQVRLERLESALAGRTAATPVPPQTVAGGAGAARPSPPADDVTAGGDGIVPPASAPSAAAPPQRTQAPAPAPPGPAFPSAPPVAAPAPSATAPAPGAPPPVAEQPAPTTPPAERPDHAVAPAPAFEPPGPAAEQPAPASAAAASTATLVPPADRSLDTVEALWPAVLDSVRAENAMVGTALSEGRPVDVREGGEVIVAFPPGQTFQRRTCEAPAHRELVGQALRALAGGGWRVAFEIREDAVPEADVAPPTEDEIIDGLRAAFDAQEIVPDDEAQEA